jgi:fermentation-respiration switch protein FrsA (DUF1100 family)
MRRCGMYRRRDVRLWWFNSINDEIVPFEMGQRLYEAAREPKRFVRISGSHNDGFLVSNSLYTGPVADWLDTIKASLPNGVVS